MLLAATHEDVRRHGSTRQGCMCALGDASLSFYAWSDVRLGWIVMQAVAAVRVPLLWRCGAQCAVSVAFISFFLLGVSSRSIFFIFFSPYLSLCYY